MLALASRIPFTAKFLVSVLTVFGIGPMVSGCGHHRAAREPAVAQRHLKDVRVPAGSPKLAKARKPKVAAAPVQAPLMAAPEPINCVIDRLDLQRTKDKTGLSPDPKLVEIARLEEERSCFQKSAAAWRSRMLELQGAVKKNHCICR